MIQIQLKFEFHELGRFIFLVEFGQGTPHYT
jgi:hypothetical protein